MKMKHTVDKSHQTSTNQHQLGNKKIDLIPKMLIMLWKLRFMILTINCLKIIKVRDHQKIHRTKAKGTLV